MSDYYDNERSEWNSMRKEYTMRVNEETVQQVLNEYPSLSWPDRNIRKETMQKFGVKCTLVGTPDKALHKIFFPYKIDGKVTGYKVKDLTKAKKEKGHFYTIGHVGVDCELFGQDHCSGPYNNLRIVEGECFTDDTEIFTDTGWSKFSDLTKKEKILQIDSDMRGTFVYPIQYIKKEYDGYLINFHNRNYRSLVTERHDMVCYDYKGRLIKQKANDLRYTNKIPKSVIIDGAGVDLSNNQIALQLAISADSKVDKRKTKNDYVHFEFKKERKKNRLRKILESLNIKYTSFEQKTDGYTSFNFTMPDYIIDKKLPEYWLYDMSLEQRKFVIDEQVHWDGNHVPNRNQVEFSTIDYGEAVWMHTMSHTAGYSGSIIKRYSTVEQGSFKDHSWYKVSILFKKQTITTQVSLKRDKVKYKGSVYCVTVPEGRILIKYKDCISVIGNCDLLTSYQALSDRQKSDATPVQYRGLQPQIVSIGCGTVQSVEHIANNNKFIDQYKNIYLCFDNDRLSEVEKQKKNPGMKGEEATQAVGSFLLYKKVYRIKWPDDINDCSDAYLKGKDLAKMLLFHNEEFCAENIVKFSDVYSFEEAHKPIEIGFQSYSFPKLSEKLGGFRNYEMTTLATFSSVGKSTIAFDIAADSVSQGYKPGLIFLEEMPKKTLFRAEAWKLGVHPNRYKFDPFNCGKTEEEIKDAWKWANDNFRVFSHFGAIKTDKLMEKIRYLFFSQGCNPIIFDHVSLAVSSRKDSANDTKELDIVMGEIGAFCAANPVHIMVISHVNRSASSGFKREDKPVWRRFEKEFLRGSSSLEGVSWNIIGIHREDLPNGERGRIQLALLKNREADWVGDLEITKMDPITGRFYDATDEIWTPPNNLTTGY